MILFLVGYMGCGKSCIARALAKRTGWRFVDMDKEVERKAGMSVSEIFARHGEAWFREKERQTLETLVGEGGNLVVATGGGVPVHGDNMEMMNSAGTTIDLKMEPARLVARLEHGRTKRPLIKDMDDRQLLEFIERNLAEREPFYNRARVTIDCAGASDDYICSHIERVVMER